MTMMYTNLDFLFNLSYRQPLTKECVKSGEIDPATLLHLWLPLVQPKAPGLYTPGKESPG